MINIEFTKHNKSIKKISVKGHANFDSFGNDIVCAAITGIINGFINALDIYFKEESKIEILENEIKVEILNLRKNSIQTMIQLLKVQFETIELQFSKNVKIKENN